MRAVARITLAYFSAVPLQGWLSGAGAAVMIIAGLLHLRLGASAGVPASAMLGAAMIIGVPMVIGGGLLRLTSRGSIMHLRPHGRLVMLAAATAAITLIATLASLPVLLASMSDLPRVRVMFDGLQPAETFLLAWSLTALLWLAAFVLLGSILAPLVGFLPLGLVPLWNVAQPYLPGAPGVFAASVAAWALFCLWYLRTFAIGRPFGNRSNAADHQERRLGFLTGGSARGAVSHAGAMTQYLHGMSSMFGHLLFGVGYLLLTLLVAFWFSNFARSKGGDPGAARFGAQAIFLPLFTMLSASLGFGMTRRARLLWLRAGLDRAALFARAERRGLLACLLCLGVIAITLLALALAQWPDRTTAVLVFGAAQLAFAVPAFYCGLSLTRGWYAGDFMLCINLCIFFFVEVIMLRPWHDAQSAAPVLLGIELALIPLLRWHARRRWLELDWRVAKLAVLPSRAV